VRNDGFWKKAKIQINGINISNIKSNSSMPLEFDNDIQIKDIKFVGIDKLVIEKWDG
jgi:hypothetical protein